MQTYNLYNLKDEWDDVTNYQKYRDNIAPIGKIPT
jgi:hypothetical protein